MSSCFIAQCVLCSTLPTKHQPRLRAADCDGVDDDICARGLIFFLPRIIFPTGSRVNPRRWMWASIDYIELGKKDKKNKKKKDLLHVDVDEKDL